MNKIITTTFLVLSLFLLNSGSVLASNLNVSSNWSGYVMPSGNFTEIQGSWTVPDVQSQTTTKLKADATWIGIGGVQSKDLIQIGTQSFAEADGRVYYFAFYETLPQVATPISLKVNPGDKISAQVLETNQDRWLVSIKNNTTGEIYSKKLNYSSSHSSAEWIEERPIQASTGKFLPLNDFGSVTFDNASATKDGVNTLLNSLHSGVQSITMKSQNIQLAEPSVINANGGFTVAKSNVESPSTSLAVSSLANTQSYKLIRGKHFQILIYYR